MPTDSENACQSGKTGGDRRPVKTALMTRLRRSLGSNCRPAHTLRPIRVERAVPFFLVRVLRLAGLQGQIGTAFRQIPGHPGVSSKMSASKIVLRWEWRCFAPSPVSYTHLTLPTNR